MIGRSLARLGQRSDRCHNAVNPITGTTRTRRYAGRVSLVMLRCPGPPKGYAGRFSRVMLRCPGPPKG
ncbi:hypothetical protein GCM10009759_75870 [Kitasatospora saccharophila]|uniref:Uncharacterized protein n=1 Tax=Kitasatospora saccharophila TaxID=407973 RepID=A0ABN2YA24_9ACTN